MVLMMVQLSVVTSARRVFLSLLLFVLFLSNTPQPCASDQPTTLSDSEGDISSYSYCDTPLTDQKVRGHRVSITDFGAAGDGITLNTEAFQNAMFYLQSFSGAGGAELFIPAGRWLTGSFGLISHLSLVLDKDAVILGSQDPKDYPIIDPLPSYGRGRELPGRRYQSLIYGYNLTDVLITGANGTIDGQGSPWWVKKRNGTLDYNRPHLIEFINTTEVLLSNLTLVNSPFWTVHPVYCSQVRIQNLTILNPLDSPNTDGVNPDSSNDVCIQDCYISVGDDVIAIKSGWDEYGISFGRPSYNIVIRRIVGQTHSSSGIALGSEMSGGIYDVHVEDVHLFDSNRGLRIKTAPGRGGYVRNIYFSNVVMKDMKVGIVFTSQYGEHPDENYNPNALPVIQNITYKDIVGDNITLAGQMEGILGDPVTDICLINVVFNVTQELAWNCTSVEGFSSYVLPEPCQPLQHKLSEDSCSCYGAD